MKHRTLIFFIAALTWGQAVMSAQDPGRADMSAGIFSRYSYILDGHGIYDRLAGGRAYPIYGAEGSFQTGDGNPDAAWFNRAYNYPEFSVGLSHARMGNIAFKEGEGLGDILNLYGTAAFHFVRTPSFRFGPCLELGVSYTPRTYDYLTNPQNRYVGSRLFAVIGTGLKASWCFAPHWSAEAGAWLTHHSNGMLRSPNLGINEAAAGIGLRYHFRGTGTTAAPDAPQRPAGLEGFHWGGHLAAGVHSCPVELDAAIRRADEAALNHAEAPARIRLTAALEAAWQYTPVFATGAGLQLDYAANDYRQTDLTLTGRSDPKGYSPLRAGAYLLQEFHYRKFSVHLILGLYAFKKSGLTEDVGRSFQKIGLRYRIGPGGLYAGLDMRAHQLDRSYSLEWSLGKRF